MTQRNTNRLFFSSGYFDNKLQQETLHMRILHFSTSEMEKGTHHLIFEEKNGKKMPRNFECPKGASFGEQRNEIYCPVCATERYAPTSKTYMWYLDLMDLETQTNEPKLKWIALPYTAMQSLETLQTTFLGNTPLFETPVTLTRVKTQQGNATKTTYTFYPSQNFPRDGFELAGWLSYKQQAQLPAIFGDAKDFPPIIKTTAQDLVKISQGLMPWTKDVAQPPVTPGNGTYNPPGYSPTQAPTGYTPPQATTPTYQPQTAPVTPFQYGAPQQPVQQPVHAPAQPPVQEYRGVPDLTGDPGVGLDLTSPNLGIVSDALPTGYGVNALDSPYGGGIAPTNDTDEPPLF